MIEDNINNSNNNNYLLQNTEYINNIILTEFNMKTSQQPQMYQGRLLLTLLKFCLLLTIYE
jgi:hypothetical protein